MKSITDFVYNIPFLLGYLNIYVIETQDGLALVDTGISAQSIDRVEKDLKAAGRSLGDVKHVLITHAHADHTGGLANLQKRSTARTYAHRREALVIQGEMPVARPPRESLDAFSRLIAGSGSASPGDPARVDVQLQDGDVLDHILPGLRVVELNGHAHGQVGYYWPERRLLFGGDVMMHYHWGLRMPLRPYTADWQAAGESVRQVATMDVDILCLGHGKPIIGGANTQINGLAARL